MSKLLLFFLLMSCDQITSWYTPRGGDFILRTPTGVLNTAELRGKTLFIFFGFLHCPHVCPTTIRELNRMMKSLSPKEREKVVPIFVSVDPERDTLPVLKNHFASMDPGFVAVTGTEQDVRSTLKLFGGDYNVIKGKEADDIFIDHTSSVFVINQKGVWVNSLPYDSSAAEFKRALAMSETQAPYWSDVAQSGRIHVLGENEECDLGKTSCSFKTSEGVLYELSISPLPVRHLETSHLTIKTNERRLTPRLVDLVGVERAMGLLRPGPVKTNDNTWVASFKLPTCELRKMNWKLRLLLQDAKRDNYEIKFKFSSQNDSMNL